MSPSPNGQKIILLYGDNPNLYEQVKKTFVHFQVINHTELLPTFDFIKDNYVEALLFETYQVEPFNGVNENDMDVLLYYASSEESQNKHMVFLPIDPLSQNEEGTNIAKSYYETLYEKYIFLLPPVTVQTLEEDSISIPEPMQRLSSIVSVLDDAIRDLDEKVLSEKGATETLNSNTFKNQHHFTGDDEELIRLTGGPIEKEENTVVSGWVDQEDKFSQTISGDEEEDKFNQVINGEKEDLAEEKIKIEGSKEEIKDEKFVVKGSADLADSSMRTEKQDINSRNAQGMTPIMVLARLGHTEKVKKLLQLGANPDLLSHQGKTLLHYACRGSNDLNFIEELIDLHGLKVNKRDSRGHDPLFEAIVGNNDELIDYLVYKGARLETKHDGDSLLHIAVKNNAYKCLKQLLISGANLKSRNRLGDDIVTFCKKKRLLKPLIVIAEFSKEKKEKVA